jgi:hypothetical protein
VRYCTSRRKGRRNCASPGLNRSVRETQTGTTNPLKQFHSAKAEKSDTRRLVHSINKALGEQALPFGTIDRTFDLMWPELEKSIHDIPSPPSKKYSGPVILDESKSKQLARMHQASIAFKVSTVIDETLRLLETDVNAFDSDHFYKAIYAAILEGREHCTGFVNLKVGPLPGFFDCNFTPNALRTVTCKIESILLNPKIKPIAKRTMLFRTIRALEEDIFARLRDELDKA